MLNLFVCFLCIIFSSRFIQGIQTHTRATLSMVSKDVYDFRSDIFINNELIFYEDQGLQSPGFREGPLKNWSLNYD